MKRALCKVGDRVKLVQTRPMSKEKNWRVVQVMEKGNLKSRQRYFLVLRLLLRVGI